MANMFDWNAVEQKINMCLADYQELDRSKAMLAVVLAELLEIDLEEAVDSITDGGHDRGIDALFIDEREQRKVLHLFQGKCVTKFESSKKNFPSAEIDKITGFLSDLLDADMKALKSANPLLTAKISDALALLRQPGASVVVHFVGNLAPLVENERSRIEAAFEKYAAVSFVQHDLDTISDFFLEKRTPKIDREITAIDKNFFDRTDQDLKAVVCTVTGSDIVEMIRSPKDPESVDSAIFDQNVRVYLKQRNRINRQIKEAALDEKNHMFWYQNNGITMTCDKIDMAPAKRSPSIKLTNVQIVNGGQTSNSLFEAAKENADSLEDVLILVRIIETSSEDVKLRIAETTNSQTPINARDLRSNDRQQRQLEEAFADLGFFYERKSRQHESEPRAKRIDALSAGQALLAYGEGLPETAKKDRGRVFGDLYDQVFSEETTADRLLTSFQILGLIEAAKSSTRKKIKQKEQLKPGEMSLIDGAYHALFATRQICLRDGIDQWDFEQAKTKIKDGISVVGELYESERSSDENFSSNRYFKDALTKDAITKRVN